MIGYSEEDADSSNVRNVRNCLPVDTSLETLNINSTAVRVGHFSSRLFYS